MGGLMHIQINPLDEEAFWWRPDPLGNSIGHTIWHVARWMDVLVVVVLQDRGHEDEQWHTSGWREKTGYDPRGIGFNGFGVITGYTAEEVNAIPIMAKDDLVAYFDQTLTAFRDQLLVMTDESLQEPAPGSHQGRLAYQWIKAILLGESGHVGEVEALIALRARRA
jgi:hypothetical protein